MNIDDPKPRVKTGSQHHKGCDSGAWSGHQPHSLGHLLPLPGFLEPPPPQPSTYFPQCPPPHTYLSSSLSWATPMPNMERAKLNRAALKGSEVLRLGLASRRTGGAGDEGRERDSLGRTWQGNKELSLTLSGECQHMDPLSRLAARARAREGSCLPSGPRRVLCSSQHTPGVPDGGLCQRRGE